MNDSYIFAGPSLFGLDCNQYPGITFLGPVKFGDLPALVKAGARKIGIVDGCFETVAPVRHKEIVACIEHGVEIFGSSSMGALRAAECAAFGMCGVGEVYRQYADGTRVEDGDVAMMHGPVEMGYIPLTIPLVDLDHALWMCAGREELDQARHAAVMKRLGCIDYRERDLGAVLDCLGDDPRLRENLAHTLSVPARSLKTLDALALLQEMCRPSSGSLLAPGRGVICSPRGRPRASYRP